MATENQPPKRALAKVADVDTLLNGPMRRHLERALPKLIPVDKMIQVALSSISRNPKLLGCSRRSLMGSILESAQLGLVLDGLLGQAYLIPYGGQATLQIGYKGYIALASRSVQVSHISAQPVYAADQFNYTLGTSTSIEHKPSLTDRGQLIAAYAVVHYASGGTDAEIVTPEDIAVAKKASKTAQRSDSPWQSHEPEMWRKTAIRKLCKRVPLSPELTRAATLDEYGDFVPGVVQPHVAITELGDSKLEDALGPDLPPDPRAQVDVSKRPPQSADDEPKKLMTDKQRKRLFATFSELHANYSTKWLIGAVHHKYAVESTNDLTCDQAEELIADVAQADFVARVNALMDAK